MNPAEPIRNLAELMAIKRRLSLLQPRSRYRRSRCSDVLHRYRRRLAKGFEGVLQLLSNDAIASSMNTSIAPSLCEYEKRYFVKGGLTIENCLNYD